MERREKNCKGMGNTSHKEGYPWNGQNGGECIAEENGLLGEEKKRHGEEKGR